MSHTRACEHARWLTPSSDSDSREQSKAIALRGVSSRTWCTTLCTGDAPVLGTNGTVGAVIDTHPRTLSIIHAALRNT